MINPFKHIYGPVYSWRLGRSLGIDPLSEEHKICNLNCSYCQLGRTFELTTERKNYVEVAEIVSEIKRVPNFFIDYISFSGRGEPTLAKNLGDMIRAIKKIRFEKIAVITNSLLLNDTKVQEDLMPADFVLAKLDAPNQELFNCIEGVCNVNYKDVIEGIYDFKNKFKGKLALQIMLVNDNISYLSDLADIANRIKPNEIQLNTPIRPCFEDPLSRDTINQAKKFFKGFEVSTCYDAPVESAKPLDEKATVSRHGNYRKSRYVY